MGADVHSAVASGTQVGAALERLPSAWTRQDRHLSVCVSVCPSVCLSVCLSVRLSVLESSGAAPFYKSPCRWCAWAVGVRVGSAALRAEQTHTSPVALAFGGAGSVAKQEKTN